VRLSTLSVQPSSPKKRAGPSTATGMPVASKLSASSTITPEIWSKIFHLATFIPDEWDAVANRVDMGILYFKDLQAQAYFSVLPLRRTIVEVCQLWHKIGTKLLYASFHCTTLESEESSYRLAAFAHVLVARPHLGRLVKRLALPWSPTVTDIELIIRHCPNAIIFSSLWAGLPALSLPWVRSLPESLRGLEANVGGMEVAEIMRILFTLPNLELLRMWNFGKAEGPSRYPRLRFPALRVLFLLFDTPKTIKSWVPILSNMDAPKLTALCTDIGKLSCAASSFPRDIWERITYLAAREKGYRYIRHTYLLNLKHLHLPVEENHTLQKLGVHFCYGCTYLPE